QIPALLNSLAAGMVVTRAVRGDDTSLANEIPTQLGQLPKVRVMIGCAAIALGLVPGMPAIPFLIIGLAVLLSVIYKGQSKEEGKENLSSFRPKLPPLLEVRVDTARAAMIF